MAKNNINRRDFLKIVGGTTALTFAGCAGGASRKGDTSASDDVPKDKMEYRTSPKGDKVSLLGYGCMRWPKLSTPAEDGNICDQEAVNELVDYAIEHGVNYFDTAPVYMQGWSERTMGVALSRYPRESYYLATKLSNFGKPTWSREASMRIYHNSFAYLKTDYIDYMLLHAVGTPKNDSGRYLDNGMLDFLVEERAAGRIRNLGFSFHGSQEGFDNFLNMHDTIKWDFVQIQHNYLDWRYARDINPRNVNSEYLYGELKKRGIPVIIMEPLLGGRLASVPEYIAAQYKVAEPNNSIASWAFRYVGNFPEVLTVLSGMTYKEHLQDNIRNYAPLKPLSDENLTMLDNAAKMIMEYNAIPCNDCKYCMPCPDGLDIPAILLHYNKCIFEESIVEESSDPKYREARRAFLVGYDRSVPKLRQANRCTGCGECNHHCPQKIDIPKELRKIDAYAQALKLKQNGL
ncbi:MAG: aldo/keto reductase [Rikenellaceae bacterium]